MTTEKELREILNSYGVGLEIKEFSKNDRVVTYPTRYQGIHRMELTLRGHLSKISLEELLKHELSKKDFEDWKTKNGIQDISSKEVNISKGEQK
ncbi:MAG: hypothetical protein ABSB71_07895 [Candidatus Bathyarchaeia archaeon]|jgi:hypothetical protein